MAFMGAVPLSCLSRYCLRVGFVQQIVASNIVPKIVVLLLRCLSILSHALSSNTYRLNSIRMEVTQRNAKWFVFIHLKLSTGLCFSLPQSSHFSSFANKYKLNQYLLCYTKGTLSDHLDSYLKYSVIWMTGNGVCAVYTNTVLWIINNVFCLYAQCIFKPYINSGHTKNFKRM